MLELWDQEFKKKKQKKPDSHAKGLMDNGDNEEEQMDNVNLEVKILRKNQVEMLEIKSSYNRNKECLWWAC